MSYQHGHHVGLKKNLKKCAQLQFGKRRVSQYFELANQANRSSERKNIHMVEVSPLKMHNISPHTP